MKINLNGKVALVTGSAHRVGKNIALALADEGVNIMVNYRSTDPDTVRDTLHDIKSTGVDAFDVQGDLSKPDDIRKIMKAVREEFGRLDILVNSASVFPSGGLLETSLETWNLAMEVNLRAPFLLTQAAAPLMRETDPPGGVIINICDQGAFAPWPERAAHGISKAALWMLTQASAIELGPDIRVNAVVPGPVMKPPGGNDERWMKLGEHLPLKTTGSGEDVGRAVVFLASESFLNGTFLHVNGGEHLMYPRQHMD
jgi:NAD(P)-dependent dehydrogenase (short-subunit alcohol dehydrogenase family)